jgi:hypothetical protein
LNEGERGGGEDVLKEVRVFVGILFDMEWRGVRVIYIGV